MSEKEREFPPIAVPNLSRSDVMFLVDAWLDDLCILSTSLDGNEGDGTLVNTSRLVIPINDANATDACPIELKLSKYGHFASRGYNITSNIYVVRLTDGKTICVNRCGRCKFGIVLGKDVSENLRKRKYIVDLLNEKGRSV
mmetsp:Transcript_9148/g.13552  ORF Transcript_9148/g.13552 Transcript_9148/m.13552 type:complete len:141 (+) Transcript_9148:355-777(+)